MPDKKQLSLLISAAFGLNGLLVIPGFAQDAPADSEDDLILEEVIVTGTRIKTVDGFGRTSPVTVIGMDEINSLGYTRVEEFLNTLPQMEPDQTSFRNNGATGTANLDLRGLGPQRTLTLINGRRMQPGGVYAMSADVNQIPSQMIERVEVLTGGASAAYGADAVAGVVNFIMRRVDGIEISASINGYQHDNRNRYIQQLMDKRGYEYPSGNTGIDGRSYSINIVIGGDFADGRGNATAYATWRKNDPLLQGSRDYRSCALNNTATACSGSITAPIPTFFIAPLVEDGVGPLGYDWDDEMFLVLKPDNTLAPASFGDPAITYNYAPINYIMRPDERWSLGAFIDYEINQHAVVYLETMGFNDDSNTQLAESGIFFNDVYPLLLNNAYFPDNFRQSLEEFWPGEDEFGVYIGKRNNEGGPRRGIFNHNSLRIVSGIRGTITDDWDYDVSYLHARTSSSTTYINDILTSRIATAVDSRLCEPDPSCIPYQVFTYQGVSEQAAAALGATAIADARTGTSIFQAYVTGDTGWGISAGSIMAVAGYERRKVSFDRTSDELYEKGLLAGQYKTPSLAGAYTVDELFLETNIPLLADHPLARKMTLDLAYRWSDYSTAGGSSTYRAGLDWQIVDWLRLRSGYNRAVRTPNIAELYDPQFLGEFEATDPCWGPEPLYTVEQCARTGVTPAQYGNIIPYPDVEYGPYLNGLWGGNPDLDPEKADTVTVGFVFDLHDTSRLSLDYWDIRIEGKIANMSTGIALDQCALYDRLCELVVRGPTGSLWRNKEGYVKGILWNLGESHSRGIDLSWNWVPGNHWSANLIGTYYLKKGETFIANDPDTSIDCVGIASVWKLGVSGNCFGPHKWRHIASVTYDSESFWAVSGRWRYYSKIEYSGDVDQIAADNLVARNYFDLSAVFRFLETHDFSVGVNNILDKEPPLVGGEVGGNLQSSGYYDRLGRFLFANLTLRW